jgi:hypothetical protein
MYYCSNGTAAAAAAGGAAAGAAVVVGGLRSDIFVPRISNLSLRPAERMRLRRFGWLEA